MSTSDIQVIAGAVVVILLVILIMRHRANGRKPAARRR